MTFSPGDVALAAIVRVNLANEVALFGTLLARFVRKSRGFGKVAKRMIAAPSIPTQMEYRSLGRTGLRVSAVGFGTAQLRRVSEAQAIDTLLRGFELGVNIVHTAPDYEGAEDLVAAAVARSRRRVIVASNAYDVHQNRTGRVRLFERLFEATCRKLRTDRLDLFGIASVDDREAFGENVWGRHGMVEFLQRMKAKGRLGATFCTTHGKPEFTRKLIESGAFDAMMLAYNDLGFHSLTLNPPVGWHFEDIRRTGAELFPLCQERGIGVMVMLPFGGGLLCRSKAFPPEEDVPDVEPPVRGADVLGSILAHPAVSCVLPGTASTGEAEENARAGHAPLTISAEGRRALDERLKVLQTTLCSRCGACEPLCSQKLPISWMFRAGYMALYPSSPYETWEDVEYFRLHPKIEATCATCPNVTCICPVGIDIPTVLSDVHGKMVKRLRRGAVAPALEQRQQPVANAWFHARVITRELPDEMRIGRKYVCRLFVENRGARWWHPPREIWHSAVRMRVIVDGNLIAAVPVRDTVVTGGRCHFVFELTAPHGRDRVNLRLLLVRRELWIRDRDPLELFGDEIPVRQRA